MRTKSSTQSKKIELKLSDVKNDSLKKSFNVFLKNISKLILRFIGQDKIMTVVASTTDYKKFKAYIANRGKDKTLAKTFTVKDVDNDGIPNGRVGNIIKKIIKDVWVDLFGLVYVNLDGTIIDGHHTFEARKILKLPIYYIVLDDELVNPKGKTKHERNVKLATIISNLNDTNNSWTAKEHFNCALTFKLDLATFIETVRKLLSTNSGLEIKTFANTHIYALIKRDGNVFRSSKKITVEDYNDSQMYADAQSSTFQESLEFYSEVIPLLVQKPNGSNVKNKVLKVIFSTYFNRKIAFCEKTFLKGLKKDVNIVPSNQKDIVNYLNNIYEGNKVFN